MIKLISVLSFVSLFMANVGAFAKETCIAHCEVDRGAVGMKMGTGNDRGMALEYLYKNCRDKGASGANISLYTHLSEQGEKIFDVDKACGSITIIKNDRCQ